jgi:hypothetical protein
MNTKQTHRLIRIVHLSLAVCRRHMSSHSHKKSPRKFTQPQLMTCLILRALTKTTYRGFVEFLAVSPVLQEAMGLRSLPHFSTLQCFAERLNPDLVDSLLGQVLKEAGISGDRVAMDATGVSTTSASAHYVARSGKTRERWVKLSVAVLIGPILAVSLVCSWGPSNDLTEASSLLARAVDRVPLRQVVADSGYDAEGFHQQCRQKYGVESLIPIQPRRNGAVVTGEYRNQMKQMPSDYRRRWNAESFFSGLKRITGNCLLARKPQALFVEGALRVLAYTIRR